MRRTSGYESEAAVQKLYQRCGQSLVISEDWSHVSVRCLSKWVLRRVLNQFSNDQLLIYTGNSSKFLAHAFRKVMQLADQSKF